MSCNYKFEVDVKLGFKTSLQLEATRMMLKDFKVSWSDVLRMGLIALERHKGEMQLISELDGHMDAHFYMRELKRSDGYNKWHISKIIARESRSKNLVPIKIYEVTKLSDLNFLILYTDNDTPVGEYKSIKKLKKHIDKRILERFFGNKGF